MGENPKSTLILITDTVYPRIKVTFGGSDQHHEPQIIDVDGFIGVKGLKAKGKRINTWDIAQIEEIEPIRFPEEPKPEEVEETEESEESKDDNGQLSLF